MTLVNTETGELADMINYDVHPVAALFPFIEGEAFREFVEDIRVNGQREPVVLDKRGRLMDGRNRARACQALGIDVDEKRYAGDDTAEGESAWIISHNVHRRHLTESQRAMVAARLANMRQGARTDLSPIGERSAVKQADAAAALNVAPRSVSRAKSVLDSGDADLIKSVDSGQVTVAKAEKQVKEKSAPPATRDERADLIEELAAQGYSSRQMADKAGVSADRVREIARAYNIDVPADKAMGKTRHHDSNNIAANTVAALEGLAMGVGLIDYDDLDPSEKADWADSLKRSLKALNAFAKKI